VPLEENPTVLEQVKLKIAETAKSFQIDMWLARQTQEKVLPVLQKFIEGAKEEFADAVANGGGIYAVGYCFGGKYVLLLGADHPEIVGESKKGSDEEQGAVKAEPLIKAGALAHGTAGPLLKATSGSCSIGTLVTKQDLEAVKAPISMACIGMCLHKLI